MGLDRKPWTRHLAQQRKHAAEEINSKLRTGAGVKTEAAQEENLCTRTWGIFTRETKMKQGWNRSAPRKMKNLGRLTPKNSATTPNCVQGTHLLQKKIMTGRGNGTPCAGSGENTADDSDNPSTKRRYEADRDWAARGKKWKLNMENLRPRWEQHQSLCGGNLRRQKLQRGKSFGKTKELAQI
jgi:hypothetical protein